MFATTALDHSAVLALPLFLTSEATKDWL
jgi:hypothetical protein